MKVYELAKELGMDSISLLDKLAELNIKVKSHMSALEPGDVETARTSLKPKEEKPAARTRKKTATTKKKTTVKKKTTAKTAAASTSESGAPVRKRTTTAKAAEEDEASAKPAAAPIIRRRTRAGGTTTETVISPSGKTMRRTTDAHPVEDLTAKQKPATGEEATPDQLAQFEGQTPSTEEEAAALQGMQAESTTAARETADLEGMEPGESLIPKRPSAPKRSVLTIVKPEVKGPKIIKPAEPARSPTEIAAGDRARGTRIFRMNKESLDQMAEEEQKKKGRGTGRQQEIRPEDVRFADYRKKEMVFLPKKKRIPIGKELKRTEITTPKAQKRVVEMEDTISVQNLAQQLGVKANELIKKLMMMGQMANINAVLDIDTASLISSEFGYEVKNIAFKEEEILEIQPDDAEESLKPRPPVVTIMGHVDHGKTSLLDAVRQANVVASEAGGITQHIGAYTVERNGKLITFIDTPGHEAFTVMRARGANVTDIVILVVAADDGVMPQTREAVSHAQAAGVPIIVAVNKIDKPSANAEKIKQQLSELNLLPEDWGGDTMFVPVSATQKTNLDQLLEAILLNAEVLELKANPDARASGTVLEARLEKGRGPVASVLVRRGTLKLGDPLVCGSIAGRIRAMMNDRGEQIKTVSPGMAAEILGLEGVPNAGERFDSPENESDAKRIAKFREDQARETTTLAEKVSLDDFFAKVQEGKTKELSIILKADVYGSVEAVRDSLTKLSNDQVKVKVIHSAAGGITESDVLLASASNAVIIGFNVRPETKARQVAESEHVDIKCYQIIYELLDEVKKAMAGLLEKKKVEKFLGRAEVRQTFSVPKIGTIAGCAVIDGKMVRGANVRLLRDSRVVFEGKMSSLKRFKDDAKEVATGYECGIGLEGYNDLKPGDIIEAYEIELVTAELHEPTVSQSANV